MEGGDIDKGGVVDGEVFEVGYGDVFVVLVAEEKGVALLRWQLPGPQFPCQDGEEDGNAYDEGYDMMLFFFFFCVE